MKRWREAECKRVHDPFYAGDGRKMAVNPVETDGKDSVHILPREMLGRSTFGLSMWLLRWLPVRAVDRLLLLAARLLLGDTAKLGLPRPQLGPLELKLRSGKTPVLDVGTLEKIKSEAIKVRPAIEKLTEHGAEFTDGRSEGFDAVVLATGYKSNVPCWLKEQDQSVSQSGGNDFTSTGRLLRVIKREAVGRSNYSFDERCQIHWA
ncbi:hypothetical protein OPV22_000660 [Ensete ventricosum]|uniref:indole-3-pyruvate monooxygenase n=1 Tax=Ensete ventricosum TaxID=4639 RepID=A0AAV8QGS4_ENSVE|nr:hypothetical protein OPV22_000660 [Ensete ventricosum]